MSTYFSIEHVVWGVKVAKQGVSTAHPFIYLKVFRTASPMPSVFLLAFVSVLAEAITTRVLKGCPVGSHSIVNDNFPAIYGSSNSLFLPWYTQMPFPPD